MTGGAAGYIPRQTPVPVGTQHIHQADAENSAGGVIGPQKKSQQTAGGGYQCFQQPRGGIVQISKALFDPSDSGQSQKAEKQGEEHILRCEFQPGAVQRQVKAGSESSANRPRFLR